jgi:hypothetical protein
VGFVLAGDPNQSPAKKVSGFPLYLYGSEMANKRCAWWQQAFVEGLVLPAASTTPSASTPSGNVPRSPASKEGPWEHKLTMALVGASTVWPLVLLA